MKGTERNKLLKQYKDKLDKAKEKSMVLVEFGDDKIHRFELEALETMVEEINQDFKKQGIKDILPEIHFALECFFACKQRFEIIQVNRFGGPFGNVRKKDRLHQDSLIFEGRANQPDD